MKRASTLATLTLTLLALTATTATTALGTELLENLPEKTRTNPSESIGSVAYETLTGLKLVCTSMKATGEETTSKPPSGTFHWTFLGCNTTLGVNVKCTGLADKNAGELLMLGTWKLVFDKNPLTSELVTAILFQPEPVHFICAGFVLVVMEGQILCLHKNATTKSKEHTFTCKQQTGDPEENHWWDTSGVEHTVELKQRVGAEAAEKAAIGMEGKITTGEEIFADV